MSLRLSRHAASRRRTPTTASSSSPPSSGLTLGEQLLAGAVARTTAQTLLHPVDVARTRLQARGVSGGWTPGVFAKGLLPQAILAGPAGALQFLAFEGAKKRLAAADDRDATRELRVLLSGGAGALSAAVVRVPQEVLKQRIQVGIYPNMGVAVREVFRTGGVGGFYKGALATISRDVPWNALSFMFHGRAKVLFEAVKGRKADDGENLVLAGMSGALAAVIMTPVDVVKTRLMTQAVGVPAKYSGIAGTLKMIVREEGAATLMKGVLPRVCFLAPLAGITFSVYELVAKKIKENKQEKKLFAGRKRYVGVVAGARRARVAAFVVPPFAM